MEQKHSNRPLERPDWLKVRVNLSDMKNVEKLVNSLSLNTVCKSANCPNTGECFRNQTATFMIMGHNCTRNCRFCNVHCAKPTPLDPLEPYNVAKAVKSLNLKHAVITSVTRDDLADSGADHFRKVINEIKKSSPDTTIEVLIPDMKGDIDALDVIINAKPDIINHNVETIKYFYKDIRPQAIYQRSLDVLKYVKKKDPSILTKTGFMVGFGETEEQVFELMNDIREVDCDILTVGQYLQPTKEHFLLVEYVHPETFKKYEDTGYSKGFKYVFSGPLVRSSYNAGKVFEEIKR